ncbi:hypothetical protein H106_07353 [Trichophyton rubrum CBS 735.88]|nr:hypothetical protein H106_07353 [Trichophyton rubrum CBS 735.88]
MWFGCGQSPQSGDGEGWEGQKSRHILKVVRVRVRDRQLRGLRELVDSRQHTLLLHSKANTPSSLACLVLVVAASTYIQLIDRAMQRREGCGASRGKVMADGWDWRTSLSYLYITHAAKIVVHHLDCGRRISSPAFYSAHAQRTASFKQETTTVHGISEPQGYHHVSYFTATYLFVSKVQLQERSGIHIYMYIPGRSQVYMPVVRIFDATSCFQTPTDT